MLELLTKSEAQKLEWNIYNEVMISGIIEILIFGASYMHIPHSFGSYKLFVTGTHFEFSFLFQSV